MATEGRGSDAVDSVTVTGRALVTGASGFIGSHLTRRLAAGGAEVHAVSRSRPPEQLARLATWHRLDLADPAAVADLVAEVRPEFIFHLASKVIGARDLDLLVPTFQANLASTVHLLAAAADHGVRRFVQVGSLEEPEVDAPVPIPSSPYAAAKAAASSYALMCHRLYDLPVVLARVFMVYGPGRQDPRKLVPYVIRTLLEGGQPQLSSGVRPVDFVYVDDVVEGFLRLAATPGLDGGRVDLGSGEVHTIGEAVTEIYRQLAPDRQPRFGGLADRQAEQVRRARVDQTERLLGWRPSTSLAQGLATTIDWFRSRS